MSQKLLTFYVSGMKCGNCSQTIREIITKRLATEEFITLEAFHADITTSQDPKRVTVALNNRYEIDSQKEQELWTKIKDDINSASFYCTDVPNPENQSILGDTNSTLLNKIAARSKQYFSSHWFKGTLGCIAGFIVLITCLTAAPMSLAVMLPLAGSSVLLTLALSANSYIDAWKKWQKSRLLTMDSLFVLSTSWILIISLASLSLPWLPMMFDAALLIYGFRHLGLAIENTIKEKIGTTKFYDRTSKTVNRITTQGTVENIPINQVTPGDTIVVEPGELIPLNGTCLQKGIIDEKIKTGEIFPRLFSPGEEVLAGMRLEKNTPSEVEILVTKNYQDSHLTRLDSRIEKAILDKSSIELQTEQLLKYFIPSVLLLAITTGAFVSIFFSPILAIQSIATILVSACPCTLGLITPLAVKTGMHKAAENGIQFNSSKSLQLAKQINTIIFDIRGTFTTGIPVVKQFTVLDNQKVSEQELRAICASLEKDSTHPTGRAIYQYATSTANIEARTVNHLISRHRFGIMGKIDNKDYIIGNHSLMKKQGINIPSNYKFPNLEVGDDLIFVAHINTNTNTIIGSMVMNDPLRDDAYDIINTLRSMNKEIYLCTGTAKETADRYAKALGIKEEHVRAECLPEDKTSHIDALKKAGCITAMVGDAQNDAIALATSHLGFAIFSEDKATQDAADAVIYSGALMAIASAFTISQQTVSNIHQNLFISFGYNFGMIAVSLALFLFTASTIPPAVGVILMMSQACLVLLNVFRFKEQPIPHLENKANEHKKLSPGELSHTFMMNKLPPQNNNEKTNTAESATNKEIISTPTTPLFTPKDNSHGLKPYYPDNLNYHTVGAVS